MAGTRPFRKAGHVTDAMAAVPPGWAVPWIDRRHFD